MKKLFITVIIIMLCLSLGTTVSANTKEGFSNSNIKVIEEGFSTFIYEYNGIEISGDTKLSEEQIINMYNAAMNEKVDIMGVDPGNTQVIVIPPMYKTYKNTGAKAAAELLSAYIIKKAPEKAKKSTFGAWVLNKLTGWAKVETTYVGMWTTSSYSSYEQKRVYHNTLVHYKNSNYTTPKSIQYWEATHWWE